MGGSGDCYTYENIPLKIYCDIVNTGNYQLVSNRKVEDHVAYDAWEKIVTENSIKSGMSDFELHMDLLKSYGKLLYDYIEVQSNLMSLLFYVDYNIINQLAEKGYRINTSSSKAYTESINAGLTKCKNLVSKIRSKEEKIKSKRSNDDKHANLSFSELIANLSFGIGSMGVTIPVDHNLTLASYNEYRKLIKKKIEAQTKHAQYGR